MARAGQDPSAWFDDGRGDGAQAWKHLEGVEVPTFAILDWMMPLMDGRKCRPMPKAPLANLLILLTALESRRDVVVGLDAAPTTTSSPFDPEELRARQCRRPGAGRCRSGHGSRGGTAGGLVEREAARGRCRSAVTAAPRRRSVLAPGRSMIADHRRAVQPWDLADVPSTWRSRSSRMPKIAARPTGCGHPRAPRR